FELVEAIKSGELEKEKVLEEYRTNINRYNGKLKAYITLNENPEMPSRGVLEGAPVAVKDCICTKGLKTTCASKILASYVPLYDATVVSRLREAGAVIIGKTNMDEFAMGSSTENSGFFTSRNPWDPTRVPGGSSGGSAVAVSARMAVAALGSDTGGSVRCPASFCGTVGLKTTYGLMSRYGLVAFANSLEQIGPLTKDVRDCALIMNVIAGYDEMDGTSLEVAKEDYMSYLKKDVKGLKVGVPMEFFGEGTDEAVKKEVWDCIRILEGMGATWEEAELPTLKYALPTYYLTAMSEASSNLARYDGIRYGVRMADEGMDWSASYSKTRGAGFGSEVKRRIILGTFALSAGYYEGYYLKALKVRTLMRKDFERLFKKFDVLVGPTVPTPAFKIGERVDDPLAMYMTDIDTVAVNLAGIPALSLPCGFVRGLPVGLQIIAPPLGEGRLFRVARRVEEELGLDLKPPLEGLR
ncbi:MAG: Asp-tRNA(Asn)/Glu-tRNA(Gln) amidotransferase subunit GatA, partial [Candidatus Methanomethyliaceae archaeon]|nr:Asp-tRNA(Asn)/Glu-tRNA(Gln) amidotransferase subunit GatA [Candidatus Methanomethyliaceae archaeon]